MVINLIYDDRHSEDYERLLEEFNGQSIVPEYKFWAAILDNKSVVSSINASHKMIVRYAKEIGLKEVAIAEQDLHFTCHTSWEYFLNNKPQEYDIYLAASYIPNNDIICGFHLYILNKCFYDKFLSIPDDQHIDTAVGDLKGNFIFCKPFPALQRAGWSENNKAIVNYNSVLQDSDIYKG